MIQVEITLMIRKQWLSPWLHFGHISSVEVVKAVLDALVGILPKSQLRIPEEGQEVVGGVSQKHTSPS